MPELPNRYDGSPDRRLVPWLGALPWLWAALAVTHANPPGPAARAPDDEEIARLVLRLGSEDFRDREEAAATLDRIGKPALPALREARDRGHDPEARRRARELVRSIERRVRGGEVRCFDSPGNGTPVAGVAFTPDGRRLLSGGADRKVRLWDAESGRELLRLTHHAEDGEWVKGVALSPDGRRALSAGGRAMRLWEVETGRPLRSLFIGEGGRFAAVAFTPDGRRALSADTDGVRLWDLGTGEQPACGLCGDPLAPERPGDSRARVGQPAGGVAARPHRDARSPHRPGRQRRAARGRPSAFA